MDRRRLLVLVLCGKLVDAVSTVVVLGRRDDVREAIPLARRLMAAFGVVGGMSVLTVVAVVAVGLVAESGQLVRQVLPAVTPEWYPRAIRTAVCLAAAAWFAGIGLRNFALLL